MVARSMADIRELFATEAEQRLSRLGQLVLDLEQQPDDGGKLVAEIFREVHTLKGSAAVVGFEAAGHYAHDLETRLEHVRSGSVHLTGGMIDALLLTVDQLGTLIWNAVGGDDHGTTPAATAALELLAAAFELAPSSEAVALGAESGDAPEQDPPTPSAEVRPPVPPIDRAPLSPPKAREAGGSVMVPVDRLDDLVRMVGEAATGVLRVGRVLTDRLGVQPDSVTEFTELARVVNDLQERATRTLMVPVATILDQLQRTVRDASRSLGKDVRWDVRGESTELDRNVLHRLADSLLHLVRNAVDHGIETPERRRAAGKPAQAVLRLHAMQLGSEVVIAITDDGGGIDIDKVRERAARMGIDASGMSDDDALQLIFTSGLSTAAFVSDISGRGVGLDAVHANVEAVRGRVDVRTTAGEGSEFRIVVPISLAVLHCLLVESDGQRFALPLHRVALAMAVTTAEQVHMEGRPAIVLGGKPVPMTNLAELLHLSVSDDLASTIVVVNGAAGRHALRVDGLVGERDVVVKALSTLVPRIDFIAGTSVEPDGSILLVLDPAALTDRARTSGPRDIGATSAPTSAPGRSGRVLVVDDALTVRELQRSILERAGFDVRVANDGVEALELLEAEIADLVLTDVEMPRMNGFALTEEIRSRAALSNVPILILTSLSTDSDRQRGMDAGADGYIVKSAFDEAALLTVVDRMIGRRS